MKAELAFELGREVEATKISAEHARTAVASLESQLFNARHAIEANDDRYRRLEDRVRELERDRQAPPKSSVSNDELFQRVLTLESACRDLRATVEQRTNELAAALEHAHTELENKDQELLSDITELRHEVRQTKTT